MSSPENISPVNPLPPVVAAIFLILFAIECLFQLGAQGFVGGPQAIGWRLSAVQAYAFSGDILAWMYETGRWPVEHLIRFVSYPFVHAGFTHMLIASVMFLAMGKLVAEAFGAIAMLVIFFGASAFGALVYTLFGDGGMPLTGAFPAVYGLIGGYSWVLWRGLSMVGENQARAFTLIGFLMGVQLIFGLLFEIQNDWIADLAGFFAGFGLSFIVSPGGLARLLGRLRQD